MDEDNENQSPDCGISKKSHNQDTVAPYDSIQMMRKECCLDPRPRFSGASSITLPHPLPHLRPPPHWLHFRILPRWRQSRGRTALWRRIMDLVAQSQKTLVAASLEELRDKRLHKGILTGMIGDFLSSLRKELIIAGRRQKAVSFLFLQKKPGCVLRGPHKWNSTI